jgi:phage terminase large subunit-like protein
VATAAAAGGHEAAGAGRTFVERAVQYAKDSLDGIICAGKWHKAACRRFLDDLESQAAEDWPYVLSETAADRVCSFAQLMPHVEGEWAKPIYVDGVARTQKIRLEDWQVFVLVNLFGWLHKSTGLRRFRRWYEEVARKNGKSPIAAVICNYLTFADGEPGAQVYSFATKKEQAKVVWGTAREMIRKEPDFAKLGAAYNTQAIYSLTSHSSFKPLARDHGSLDGLNTSGFLADELHAQKERGLWDVMDSSTGARAQPLGGGITTAGSDRAGICYEIRAYVCKILNGVLQRHDGLGYKLEGDSTVDETWFGIIYTIDDGDDPFDEACWPKPNPNLNVSVKLDDMRAQAQKAAVMSSALNEFLTKRLNVWVNADTAWMDMRAWRACGDSKLSAAAFAGDDCYIGLDLASKNDIASKARLFRRLEAGEWHYYLFVANYLNEEAVKNAGNSQYPGWARDGYLTVTPGNITDFGLIKKELLADAAQFNPVEIPYDPYQATQLAQEMIEEGLPMVELRQTVQYMSEPMKELEALALIGRLHHNACPVLEWMVSNVVCHRDAKDNIYPRKERYENKIDGVVAAIMALARALVGEPKTVAGYEVVTL